MKTQVINMILALGTVSGFGTSLHAQSYDLKANIPFAFHVNNKVFEPGKYNVESKGMSIPSLRNNATGQSVFIVGANPVLDGKGESKLVFHCYSGTTCFLAEIWPGSKRGTTVPKSKTEKELASSDHAREMATLVIDLRRGD